MLLKAVTEACVSRIEIVKNWQTESQFFEVNDIFIRSKRMGDEKVDEMRAHEPKSSLKEYGE